MSRCINAMTRADHCFFLVHDPIVSKYESYFTANRAFLKNLMYIHARVFHVYSNENNFKALITELEHLHI